MERLRTLRLQYSARWVFLVESLNVEQGPLGGNDLLSLEVFKSRRVMTIHVEHHRRKGKVLPGECQVPS